MARRLKTSSAYLRWAASAFVAGEPVDPASVRDGWVMGLAVGYGPEQLAPFVRSLRAVFAGRVTLVVSPRDDVLALLAEHGVEARRLPEGKGWTPHFVVHRIGLFAEMLARAPADTPVLLTDVRDVVFQADPFAEPLADIEAFPEGDGLRFRDHAFNRRYAEALAGREIAERLEDQAPLCVGTVVGRAGAVARLLRIMLMLGAIPRSGWGGAFGADQASFNLAVHLGLVEAVVQPNYRRVATLGWSDAEGASATPEGVIVNPDGSLSPIVHQYDRRPELAEAVGRRWGAPPVVRYGKPTLHDRWAKLSASLRKRAPELR